jgi:hypothetical protein
MRTDRQTDEKTDTRKLIVAFHNFAKELKTAVSFRQNCILGVLTWKDETAKQTSDVFLMTE